ncbi:MAG: NAD-dependent epimerase/dehydratase family protein [Phycisphaerales bacterium]|nr:NAD-dependent epimerase/dehydratase family protein [Phycisphaerales bacterium]
MSTRRDFLKLSAAASCGILTGLPAHAAPQSAQPATKAADPRKILILGGTGFLGPAIVEAATRRGHTLTLFNRGKTNPQLFPEIEKLRGDRSTRELDALRGRQWDAVCDDCGYIPRHVREMTDVLRGSVKQYIFISSVSALGDKLRPGLDETAPVATMADESVEKVTGETYGPLKALCEQAAERAFPGATTNIRPGLIVGPGDPTDRFTYWPVRVQRGGEILAPGEPSDPVQIIDVRDLGEWIVRVIEQRTFGVYHALGPEKELSVGAMLSACRTASKAPGELTWVNAEFLESQKVTPWGDMPVWVPPTGDSAGFGRIDNRRAIAAGLRFRPIADTARDTLSWWNEQPEERRSKLRAGISAEREAEVLRAWHARTSSPRRKA